MPPPFPTARAIFITLAFALFGVVAMIAAICWFVSYLLTG